MFIIALQYNVMQHSGQNIHLTRASYQGNRGPDGDQGEPGPKGEKVGISYFCQYH